MDDIFYGEREMYACLNWCYHFEEGVTTDVGGDDLSDFMRSLKDFEFNYWINTSLLKGASQLRVLRSAISKLKVGLMLSVRAF